MSEPLTAEINVTIEATSDGQIKLQQRYLGMSPFVLFLFNEDTEQFDIEAGGGVPDLDALKMIVGYMAAALGFKVSDSSADEENRP